MKTNYLCGLFLLCVLVWGRSEAHAEKPLKTLDLYLCIGQSNMAGRGKLSPEVMDTLQNVYLLNADDQFEPAVNPLNRYSTIGKGLSWQQVGPAYGFAKTMATKKHPVGLIVNAREDLRFVHGLRMPNSPADIMMKQYDVQKKQ